MEMKINRTELLVIVMLAWLVVAVVASFLPPLNDADRAEMIIDATSGLPQDR